MEQKNKSVNLIWAGLKFSKAEIGEACTNEKNTMPAIVLLSIAVVLGVIIAFFKGNGGSSGIGGMGLLGYEAAIAEMGSLLIGTFLSTFIMVFVIRIFKVKPSYTGVLRVYGAAISWTILKSILSLILSSGFAIVAVLSWLAYNFSILFGLAGYTQIKIWQSFLSIVLTFALVFGIMLFYGALIKTVFT